jgi:putative transcriptional regulator
MLRRARVYAGYAGWGPGQLESELDEDAWLVTPARPEDVFLDDTERLWGQVLARMGRDFDVMRTMPFDPSAN